MTDSLDRPAAPPMFIPAPFGSDKPMSKSDENWDKFITLVMADVRAGQFELAVDRIRGSHRYGQVSSVDEPALSPGEKQAEQFVYKSEELGKYIHFSLADSHIPYFLPTACRAAAERGELDVEMSMDGDPRTEDYWRVYYDVSCTPEVHLRLFSKLGQEPQFIDEVMVYRI